MKISLKKVARLPDACYSTWRLSGGAIEEHSMTLADYKALALPDAGAPENPTGDKDAAWLNAGARAAYDTPDGKLAPGDVCEWSHGDDYCNGPSDVTLVIGTPDGEKDLWIANADVSAGSKDQIGSLTADTKRPGITVIDGELSVEDKP